jgi:hypothetical protein
MNLPRALGAAALALAAGCRAPSPAPLTDLQRTAITDSVRALADAFAAWASTQGAGRAYETFFDSTPSVLMAADGRIVAIASEAVAARYHGWAPPAGARMTRDSVRVEPLAPGLAHFAGAFREAFTPPSGPAYEGHGVMTAVAVSRPGGWRFAASHTSVAPTGAAGGR